MLGRFILVLLSIALLLPASANAASSPYPEIKKVKHNDTLSSWLIEDHNLPIVDIILTIRHAGSSYAPDGKEGLTEILAMMLDEGAGNYNSIAFKNRLNDYGIRWSASSDRENFTIQIRTLSQYKNIAFEMLSLALLQPHFDRVAATRVKQQMYTLITKKLEDPDYIAELAWYQHVFGNHPYAKAPYGTHATLDATTRNDLIEFMRTHFAQDKLQVSVVGDITTDELKTSLASLLQHLPAEGSSQPHSKASLNLSGTEEIFMDIPQTVILFGQRSFGLDDPEFYTAFILNHILGGGSFESRLFKKVRKEKGLTYSIGTYIGLEGNSPILMGSASTRNSQADEAMALIKEEFRFDQPVTQEELELAKQYQMGSHILRFESNSHIVRYLDFMQQHSLRRDFMEERNKYINAVTLENVNRLAREWLDAEKLHFTAVGNTSKP